MIDLTGYIYPLLSNSLFWIIIFVVVMGVGILTLKMKKKKALSNLVLVMIPRGESRIGIVETKGGYWSKKTMLKGLIKRGGPEEFITKENEIIYGVTPEDYQEFNGKRCLFVTPNPDNPKQLFPIDKFRIINKDILSKIAPIEVTEAAIDSYEKTTKEMKGMTEQVLFIIGYALLVIGIVIALALITQYWKAGVDGTTTQNKDTAEMLKTISSNFVKSQNNLNTIPGGAP